MSTELRLISILFINALMLCRLWRFLFHGDDSIMVFRPAEISCWLVLFYRWLTQINPPFHCIWIQPINKWFLIQSFHSSKWLRLQTSSFQNFSSLKFTAFESLFHLVTKDECRQWIHPFFMKCVENRMGNQAYRGVFMVFHVILCRILAMLEAKTKPIHGYNEFSTG